MLTAERKVWTRRQFRNAIFAQDVDTIHAAFKCPACGTVQSTFSLIRAGVAKEEADRKVGFSCVGRYLGSGPANFNNNSPGKPGVIGCDWTLGGMFRIHNLEIEDEEGERRPIFEVATRAEAHALMKENLK